MIDKLRAKYAGMFAAAQITHHGNFDVNTVITITDELIQKLSLKSITPSHTGDWITLAKKTINIPPAHLHEMDIIEVMLLDGRFMEGTPSCFVWANSSEQVIKYKLKHSFR